MVIQKNDEGLSLEELPPTIHNFFLEPSLAYVQREL